MNSYFSKTLTGLGFAFFTLIMCACASQPFEKEPALLLGDDQQALKEVIDLVKESLGGKNIPIAKNVFQDSPRLLLGKAEVSSTNGVKITPSSIEAAIVFELVKQGNNCLLRRLNTDQEWTLATTSCVKL